MKTFIKQNWLNMLLARQLLASLLFVSGLVGATGASAALVTLDWKESGDGLLTLDTNTGRKWLDIDQTLNWSIDRAVADLPGFTVATTNSVRELFLNTGFLLSGSCNPHCDVTSQISLSQQTTAVLGGLPLSSGAYAYGLVLDPAGENGVGLAALIHEGYGSQISLYPVWVPTSFTPTSNSHGIWAFTDGAPQDYSGPSGVPGPLPILGLVAACAWARKIRRAARSREGLKK